MTLEILSAKNFLALKLLRTVKNMGNIISYNPLRLLLKSFKYYKFAHF